MKSKEPTHTEILKELEPFVESELNRHERMYKDWYPHDYVPWSDGKNYAYLGGEDWQPEQSRLGDASKAAMYVNLLTEDNLPSYHREISTTFGRDSSWGTWVDRWTAEEAKHSISMRDFLTVTRAINPVELEMARMQQVSCGYDSGNKSPLEAVAYVTMQELATRIAHRNTGKECLRDGDVLAEQLLARIALDENLHMIFYRNLADAALQVAPNQMMRAITNEIDRFVMPGAGTIPKFGRKALMIADAGIYDLKTHLDDVVHPTLRKLNVWDRDDLSGDGAAARDELYSIIDRKKTEADAFSSWREEVASTRENAKKAE